MNLLIVESPGKVKKIQSILGSDFKVMASFGHVRDLPKENDGLKPPNFTPKYAPTEKGKSTLASLAAAVKQADAVYLATDPDREGEAIAWHLEEALKLKDARRVTFSEITEQAVKTAVNNPRTIDRQLVKAQEGRRVLDRLMGFQVTEQLRFPLGGQASAGRVQSPALRLVVEREAAFREFKSVTHYGAELTFEAVENATDGWKAQWNVKNWLEEGDYFLDQQIAERVAALRDFTVVKYEESESRQAPPAPFITSTLQQAASNALKFSPAQTMQLAQALYEKGLITYMRTDSPNLSEEALADIRDLASKNDWPMPATSRTWKSKAGAQEAHEAVRPTHFEEEFGGTGEDQMALYRLIRLRALASQLEDAVYAASSVTLEGELDGHKVIIEANGRRLISPGWRVTSSGDHTEETGKAEAANIPKLREGSQPLVVGGRLLTRKTQPPARFTEAALVRELEKLGIGRPSTYASTLEKIVSCGFVKIETRQLVPTKLGESIIAAMKGRFGFLDYAFTSDLETRLDEVAGGQTDYLTVVSENYGRLNTELQSFFNDVVHKCSDCGKPLRRMFKEGDNGYDYWACSGRPDCKASYENTDGRPGDKRRSARQDMTPSGFKCPKCGRDLYRRQGVSKAGKKYDLFGCGDKSCESIYWTKNDQPDFGGAAKS